ncbi:MAG: hypothetical protein J6Y02_10010 [Pseudobutyrivibrio sp.]|nr:hypothetical protein [Pseudobutyrivibrio sp.]
MKNNRTNARRRAARRYIKNHSMSMAKWLDKKHQVLVNLDNPTYDLITYLNTFSKIPYETYVETQKSISNPQDRLRFKMWYYSGYDIGNIPRRLIKDLIVVAIVNHINRLSDMTIELLTQDIDPETVEVPNIDLHAESEYIVKSKLDKG